MRIDIAVNERRTTITGRGLWRAFVNVLKVTGMIAALFVSVLVVYIGAVVIGVALFGEAGSGERLAWSGLFIYALIHFTAFTLAYLGRVLKRDADSE